MRCCFSAGIPIPVSHTVNETQPSHRATRNPTCPSGGVNFSAFDSKWRRICWRRVGSAINVSSSGSTSSVNLGICRVSAAAPALSALGIRCWACSRACWQTVGTETRMGFSSISPVSIRVRSRISLTILISCLPLR